MKKILKENNIHHDTNEPGEHNKMAIVERFNRTIRSMINKYLNHHNTTNWIDILDDFIENYNNTYHTSIKQEPKSVTQPDENIFIQKKII